MREPLLLQLLHQHLEPLAFLAEEVRRRHDTIFEGQLAGVLPAQPELVELAPAHEAGRLGLHQKQADTLVWRVGVRIGLGDDDEQVADLAVGDEGLGAVEHVMVAGADGAGLHVGQVRSRARLGHGDAEQDVAGDRAGHVLPLLLLVPVGEQVRHDDVGVQRDHHGVGADPRHLLHDDGVVEKVAARAAVLHGRGGAEEACRAGSPPRVLVAHAAYVPLRHLRLDLLLREAAELLAELFVLFGENASSHPAAPWEDDLRIRTAPDGDSGTERRANPVGARVVWYRSSV